MCRVCEGREETWEHVWEECTGWGVEKGWQEMVDKVLGEGGEGERWMKELEELRVGREEGGGKERMDEERMEGKNAAETEVQRNEWREWMNE
ncbi:hypothetical protein EAG_09707 [Camponotus floridanus]|uniref:Uncharacterized protein n=1 Tax=Camponotus floridanus TaxID=104421 RepID=E2A8A5_CAMFO|nr:hypothetical protein EAG_09707 [Camponotus floridanus]